MSKQQMPIELFLLVLLSFLWGGSFTLNELAIPSIPPATIVLGRLVIGACFLLVIIRIRRIPIPVDPNLWRSFTIQGLLQSALPFSLISWGQTHIDSGMAGLLNALPPVFAFLVMFLFFKDRERAIWRFVGTLIGLLGVAITLAPNLADGAGHNVLGQLAVIGASLCYAIAPIYARRFDTLPVTLTAACSMTMAAIIMAPVAILVDQPWTLTPSRSAVFSLIGLGLCSTGVAMVLYFRLVKTLGPLGVTSGSYLRAGFSVGLGALVLSEPITPHLIGGFVMILLSVALVTGKRKPQP